MQQWLGELSFEIDLAHTVEAFHGINGVRISQLTLEEFQHLMDERPATIDRAPAKIFWDHFQSLIKSK